MINLALKSSDECFFELFTEIYFSENEKKPNKNAVKHITI